MYDVYMYVVYNVVYDVCMWCKALMCSVCIYYGICSMWVSDSRFSNVIQNSFVNVA